MDGWAAAIKRYAKTARAKKELHQLLEEVLCWQALLSPQLVHLNCKEPSGLGILL
jgi:hypothetical protein